MPGSLPGKPPPYTYDDPRLIYDELCLTYDGDVDDICVIDTFGVRKIMGGSVSRKKPKPLPDILDITIQVCLSKVNDEDCWPSESALFNDRSKHCDIFKWRGTTQDPNLSVDIRSLTVTSRNSVNGYVLSQLAAKTSESDRFHQEHVDARGQLMDVREPARAVHTEEITVGQTSIRVKSNALGRIERDGIIVEASPSVRIKTNGEITVQSSGKLKKRKIDPKPYLREQTSLNDSISVKSTIITRKKK